MTTHDPRPSTPWIVGDPKESAIFNGAVDALAKADKAKHSAILFAGISVLCFAAALLATPEGGDYFVSSADATPYDRITSISASVSMLKASFDFFTFSVHRRAVLLLLASLKTPTPAIEQSVATHAEASPHGAFAKLALVILSNVREIQRSLPKP